jgi:hypothetical protein
MHWCLPGMFLHLLPCCLPLSWHPSAAALGPCLPVATSPATNQSYYLNSSATDFAQAELACNDNGGHLVSYNRCALPARCTIWCSYAQLYP